MDFELSEEQRAIKDTARAFAHGEMMPLARQWDEEEVFPADALRQAAALGFGGIYVVRRPRRLGALPARRGADLRGVGAGLPSTAAYISIHNMVAWMIDAYRRRGAAARAPAARALQHGAVRQLLPDRAGTPARTPRASRPARCATATTTCSTAPRRSSRAAASPTSISSWRARAKAARVASPASWSRRARPGSRFGAQEKKLGWKSQPTAMVMFENCRVPVENRIGAEGQGFKIAMARARRRPAQHRGLLARRRAVLPRPHRRLHEGAQSSSARGSPISRRSVSASPTTRPSSRPRG